MRLDYMTFRDYYSPINLWAQDVEFIITFVKSNLKTHYDGNISTIYLCR